MTYGAMKIRWEEFGEGVANQQNQGLLRGFITIQFLIPIDHFGSEGGAINNSARKQT